MSCIWRRKPPMKTVITAVNIVIYTYIRMPKYTFHLLYIYFMKRSDIRVWREVFKHINLCVEIGNFRASRLWWKQATPWYRRINVVLKYTYHLSAGLIHSVTDKENPLAERFGKYSSILIYREHSIWHCGLQVVHAWKRTFFSFEWRPLKEEGVVNFCLVFLWWEISWLRVKTDTGGRLLGPHWNWSILEQNREDWGRFSLSSPLLSTRCY